jgi:DNA repair exonuclease SbcCD ATPase subunit
MTSKDIAADGMNSGTVGITYTIRDRLCRLYRSTKGDVQEEFFTDQRWHPTEGSALPQLNFHQWKVGYFLKEEELGEFLTQTPANRRDLLHKLLGVENLMAARDMFVNFRRYSKSLEKMSAARRSALSSGTGSDCAEELKERLTEVRALEEKIDMGNGRDENYRLFVELEKTRATFSSRREAISEEIKKSLSDFNDVTELNDMLKELANRLALRDQYLKQISTQQAMRTALINQLKNEDSLISSLNKTQKNQVCPTCLQIISPDQRNKLLDDIENKKLLLAKEIQKTESTEKELSKTLYLLDQLTEKYADLKERSARLQHFNQELDENEQQLAELSRKIDLIARNADCEESLELRNKLEKSKESLKVLETENALFERRLLEIKKADAEMLMTSHNRLFSEWITDALDMTIKSTMGVSLRQVERGIQGCLKSFDLLRGQNATLNLEKTQLLPDFSNRNFHSLSGSEKGILYLALKVEISRLMQGSDFMVLDSPSVYLDELRRERLRDYLLSLTPGKQIILLTNDLNFANLMTDGTRINL